MLRYRVAVLLLMFLLIGIAVHEKITVFSYDYVLASLALLFSYVSATTINDIIDVKIDRINHPHGKGRPLVSKKASKKELYVLNIITSVLAVLMVVPIGWKAVMVMLLSLSISYIYSLDPIKISHRTHLAHIFLSVAYVIVPYSLGVFTISEWYVPIDYFFMGAFTILFFGRIILKDFRDVKGDLKYGKPTFLIVYGKNITCLISVISVIFGNIMIISLSSIYLGYEIFVLQIFFFCIYFMSYRLWKAESKEKEQEAIVIGAKMGNGLILTLLGLLALHEYNAASSFSLFYSLLTMTMFLLSFIILLSNPHQAVAGYRG